MTTLERPNILFIMGDEHAPMAGATYGGPAHTPVMDQMAAEGAVFDAAYCNSPLCVPSRMSLLTGRFAHDVDAFDLASPLSSAVPTIAHAVRATGYDAVLSGKQHFVGPDQLHGFREQLARDAHMGEHPLFPWPDEAARPVWPHPLEAGPGRTEYVDIDDEVEQAAVTYLRNAGEESRPWFLCASFIAPHWPYIVPQKYWDMYPLESIDVPEVPEEELRGQHPVIQRLRATLGVDKYDEDVVRRARAAYLGAITHLDERIGHLLEVLENTGQAENTLVVYASDHGGMLGEHGLWRKMNFYEESVRVPLLMRWPGRIPAGTRISDPVSLVDLAPTFTAATSAPPLPSPAGADLLPVITTGERRDTVFSEYLGHGVSTPMAMLRRGPWKLNYYHQHPYELYNLAEDPQEHNNLSADPRFTAIADELVQELLHMWDPSHLDHNVRKSQQERLLIRRAETSR